MLMKLNEIYERFTKGETITIKGKGVIKDVKMVNGKYEVKYAIPSKPKYYGRLTLC